MLRATLLIGAVALCGCRPVVSPARAVSAGAEERGGAGASEGGEATAGVASAGPVRAEFVRTPGRVAAGDEHSCVVSAAGEVWCWGGNAYGQLGDGGEVGRRSPVRVAGLRDMVAVAADGWTSCALGRGGEVWCWGAELRGRGSDARFIARRSPVRVAGIPSARAIAVNGRFACAATASEVWCWGAAPRGDYKRNEEPPTATPVAIPGAGGADELCAGHDYACARSGGDVRCWGPNMMDNYWLPVEPRPVEGLAPAVAMVCGFERVCVAGHDGHVSCVASQFVRIPEWRDDLKQISGRLADIEGIVELVQIGGEMCGVRADGAVQCWRDTLPYGNEPPLPLYKPEVLTDVARPRALAAGGAHACALGQDGELRCWGANLRGQVGGGAESLALAPERIAGADGISGMVAGDGYTCGLRDGGVWCWGWLEQFPGVAAPEQAAPVALATSGKIHELAVDWNSLCWRSDDRVRCRQEYGYSSQADMKERSIARGARQLVPGGCVLTGEGIVDCAGDRVYDGRSFADGDPARRPYRTSDIVEVVQAGEGWCGRRKGGGVDCLKVVSTVVRAGPVIDAVSGRALRDVVDLDVHGDVCALRRSGRVSCWSPDRVFDLRARELPEVRDAVAIASADARCIIRRDRRVACWGRNHHGQLGDGTVAERAAPVVVPGLVDVRELALADGHACARTGDGAVWCWGEHLGGARLAVAVANRDVEVPRAVAGLPAL